MSKKENHTETANQEQTVVTRYDRRMQKRKQQELKLKREAQITKWIGIVILVGLVCWILSYPIRNYIAVNGTYITIGGEKITRVEFDYNYSMVYNTFIDTYGTYLYYLGIDTTGDLSDSMYSDTLTWKDYLEQSTVTTMTQSIALSRDAQEYGFEYDTTEDYEEFLASLKEYAAESEVSVSSYVRSMYGSYATVNRLEKYVKESLYLAAYYTEMTERFLPSAEEVEAYYEENTDSYDVVDYRLITVDAELPTEPTELADVSEDEDADSEEDEDAEYEPSEAEIEAAMAEAMELAEEAMETISEEADLVEKASYSSLSSYTRDWLFDAERVEGDVTIIEIESSYRYYVVQFVQRYRDDSPTADMRVIIISDEETAQSVLDEWESGEATEESFIEMFNTYSEDTSVEGGLYQAISVDDSYNYSQEILDWLFEDDRAVGDAAVITPDGASASFVVYFVSLNSPTWYSSIESVLQSEAVEAYLEEITADIEVVDKKGKLNYLTVVSEEETNSNEAEESTDTEDSAADGEDAGDGADAEDGAADEDEAEE